jgi:hypothetical protein
MKSWKKIRNMKKKIKMLKRIYKVMRKKILMIKKKPRRLINLRMMTTTWLLRKNPLRKLRMIKILKVRRK